MNYYWDCIKDVFENVSIYDGAERFLQDFAKQPAWIGDLFAVNWFLSEMSNGGIMQFFDNDTGVLAPEAMMGFRHMNLPEHAALLDQAMKYLGDEYPRDREQRNLITSKLPMTTFKDLEKQMYLLGGSNLGKIYDVMDSYAEKNAKS